MHLFNQGIPPPRGLSPLVCREKPQENPRRTQEQSKRRRIRAEEADSRRRGGRFRSQRSSIAVGVEKGGQAEEAFALCRRGYSRIQGVEEGDSMRIGVPSPSAWRREDKQRRPSQLAGAVILRPPSTLPGRLKLGFFGHRRFCRNRSTPF